MSRKPVRNIPINNRSLTGRVSTRKAGAVGEFESSLERDFLVLLDFDPAVETFTTQPLRIPWRDSEGRSRQYTPDVLVRYRTVEEAPNRRREWLFEVKYRDDLFQQWAYLKPALKAARRYCRERGWAFGIRTEVEIRGPRLENARFLRPYRRGDIDPSSRRAVAEAIAQATVPEPEAVLASITENVWERAELLHTLWQLVARGEVRADLSAPLGMRTRLWRPT
jgi:hypothetical protein